VSDGRKIGPILVEVKDTLDIWLPHEELTKDIESGHIFYYTMNYLDIEVWFASNEKKGLFAEFPSAIETVTSPIEVRESVQEASENFEEILESVDDGVPAKPKRGRPRKDAPVAVEISKEDLDWNYLNKGTHWDALDGSHSLKKICGKMYRINIQNKTAAEVML